MKEAKRPGMEPAVSPLLLLADVAGALPELIAPDLLSAGFFFVGFADVAAEKRLNVCYQFFSAAQSSISKT